MIVPMWWHSVEITCLIVCLPLKQCPKQSTDALRVDNSCLFQSLYSRKVAETIIALCLPSFIKKDVSYIKHKK